MQLAACKHHWQRTQQHMCLKGLTAWLAFHKQGRHQAEAAVVVVATPATVLVQPLHTRAWWCLPLLMSYALQ
jgi:hypothetical protein